MEKKESLVIVNLIFSHAELRRIHCRYSLEDYNRNMKWHNNQFHLPYDLSKEIRDNVFLSSNRGNHSQIYFQISVVVVPKNLRLLMHLLLLKVTLASGSRLRFH